MCSDIHGYKGVVRRNEQAVLVPPRDVEALAAALSRGLTRALEDGEDELGVFMVGPADMDDDAPHGVAQRPVLDGARHEVRVGNEHARAIERLDLDPPPAPEDGGPYQPQNLLEYLGRPPKRGKP